MSTTTNAELIAQFRSEGNEWSGKYGALFFQAADAVEAAEKRAEILSEAVRQVRGVLEAAEKRAEDAPCHHQNAAYLRMMAERDALAAVVEKVREEEQGAYESIPAHNIDLILSTAPADALREVKADVWDEGWSAAGAWQIAEPGTSYPWNPYRKEQDRG